MEKILVTRSSMPPLEEYVEEIRELWESHFLTNMGVKHKQLQRNLEKYLGVEHVDLLVNGHMALEMSIQAMNFPRGSEVITTPFTFASTTHAIVRNNLEPIFCDIEPNDLTLDVSKIESLITPKTRAIVPVHVYGNICDVVEIERIARKHDLKVIYDAAHAFGEKITLDGVEHGVCEFGDVSILSFHATKCFNTIEGGAICFRDEEFGRSIYRLKNFGIRDAETVDGIGANAKMNEFCAAMGLCNLRHIDSEIQKRQKVAERYSENLEGVRGIRIVQSQSNIQRNFSYMPILVENREQIFTALEREGFFARKYFYPLTNEFDCYKDRFDVSKTPLAFEVSRKVLTLPIYADLSLEIVDRICDVMRRESR